MAKGRLDEISSADAYKRFYEGKIPEEAFKAIMVGTDKMTPYHKYALDLAIKSEDEGNGQNILDACKKIGEAWYLSNQDARQLMLSFVDYPKLKSFDIYKFAEKATNISEKKNHTENGYSSAGYKVLVETDNALVTCTTSYAANKKYYGDSHWCTASDVFGHYNGFNMFGSYVGDSCLIQFVNKQDREGDTLQAQIDTDGDVCVVCDFNDDEKGFSALAEWIYKNLHGWDYWDLIHSFDLKSLAAETSANYQEETDYWTYKIYAKKKLLKEKLKNDYGSGKYKSSTDDLLNRAFAEIKQGIKYNDMTHEDGWTSMDWSLGPNGQIFYARLHYSVMIDNIGMLEWADDQGISFQDTYIFKLEGDKPKLIALEKNSYPAIEENCLLVSNDKTRQSSVYSFLTGQILVQNAYFVRYFTDFGGLFVFDNDSRERVLYGGFDKEIPCTVSIFNFITGEYVCKNAKVIDKYHHIYFDENKQVQKTFEPKRY